MFVPSSVANHPPFSFWSDRGRWQWQRAPTSTPRASSARSSWARTASGWGARSPAPAEEHRDQYGLRLPITIAPYQVHLCRLAGNEVQGIADKLYDEMQRRGVEVLYDDRAERPGVQYADADLIGLPLRVTVGEKALAKGGVELKRRDSDNAEVVAVDKALEHILGQIETLFEEVSARVVPVELA